MSFSNVSVFRQTVSTLNTAAGSKVPDQIKKGGAFSPSTFEAVAVMRSELDNAWDNSYIIKYQSLMQNRLNRLKQDLTQAYKALLEASSVQEIRENGINASSSAVTDVYGKLIGGSSTAAGEAFRNLKNYADTDLNGNGVIDANETAAALFAADDGLDGTSKDGVPSYLQGGAGALRQVASDGTLTTRNGVYEMRSLYVNGPALSIVNDMKVALRTEEVPPKKQLIWGADIGAILGSQPFSAGEKVAEYSAEVKAGGFFSTINYLYNFAPRELKYSYATAYSTTSEEVGTRQSSTGAQSTLFNREVTDARDANVGSSEDKAEDATVGPYGAGIIGSGTPAPPNGARVKWASSNPNDGYTTERSPIFDDFGGKQADSRLITRRAVDNDPQFQTLSTTFNQANDTVKSNWTGFVGPEGAQIGDKQTVAGTEEFGSGNLSDRIKWEYAHDGAGAADLNRDGKIVNADFYKPLIGSGTISVNDYNLLPFWQKALYTFGGSADTHDAKAIFINHYTVETQEVEMNSSVDSWGTIQADDSATVKRNKLIRSTGLDGSAEAVFNDSFKNKPQTIIDQIDTNSDGDLSGDTDTNEKLLLAGSGKISKSFNGDYISRQYQIKSFNGQNIATNSANVNISSQNETTAPVVLAEYEGYKRAESMSLGVAQDVYAKGSVPNRTREQALALATKYKFEINAAKMVDTDWHYSDYVNGVDTIMFRNLNSISYIDSGIVGYIPVDFDTTVRDGAGSTATFDEVNVGFRKTFTLDGKDIQDASYSTPTDPNLYITTPTYTAKPVFVNVMTSGIGGDLIVNGKVLTGLAGVDLGLGRFNLQGYLKEGNNVIAYQTKFTTDGADSFKLTSDGGNSAIVNKWVDAKVSTERIKTGDGSIDELNDSLTNTKLSTWQSKIMVDQVTPAKFNLLYPNPPNDKDPTGNTPATFVSDKAYQEYTSAINSLGSVYTQTKVKNDNAFARLLTEIMNKKENQDIFNLGLLNFNTGKNMIIKAQVAAPSGGQLNASIDVRYDPSNNKFVIVQSKWDALG